MRKRILTILAVLLVGGLSLHLYVHRDRGHGVLESLRKTVHGD